MQGLPLRTMICNVPVRRARLMTRGTVDQKIYRKQVIMGGLSRAGAEEGIQRRHLCQQACPTFLRHKRFGAFCAHERR